MKPDLNGLDLYNAICTVKSRKYRVCTVYNNLSQKMTYRIENGKHSICGEFTFTDGQDQPVSYSIDFPVTNHMGIQTPIQLQNESKQKFIVDFVTSRICRL